MNIRQLAILTLLMEGELSFSEIGEYTGLNKAQLKKEIERLVKLDFVEQKAVIGGDLILGITQSGIDEMIKEFPLLKSLVQEMENVICVKYGC
ncbi:winged helix-turn-helix domain-containing protein [Metallosphaera hakonensis]|uniref:Transcriptional regulator n=1 Tax=Metallosphaera hakonensis JCM 8857 = DSM 7519 TaxID=1293036 RepID=A0A2U9IVY6_9CREN|nr:winged helix-turn-helix domain-containing protein [Metallosphaera hakonensis]AWS00199.1 ArsR family transcriptional regulator [Metallosphaera hakonensis JCM 8857 = DSM 7519]